MHIKLHQSKETFTREITGLITKTVLDAARTGRKATILLPGGSSPKAIFEHMKSLDFDWTLAHFTTTDERKVERGHPDCNADQISFLNPLWLCDPQAEQILATWRWPADLILLGFGMDGHTASLFPGQDWMKPGHFLTPATAPNPPRERISIPYNLISSAQQIVLIAPDPQKIALLREIQSESHPQSPLHDLFKDSQERLQIHGILT